MKKKTNTVTNTNVFDRFELQTVRLISSKSSLNLRLGPSPQKTEVKMRCHVGANPEEHTLLVNLSCELAARYDDSPDPAILIQCEHQVVYKREDETLPSTDDVKSNVDMINQSATHQLWPFIRHHVAWMSSQFGIPPLFLPLWRPTVTVTDVQTHPAPRNQTKIVKRPKRPTGS